MTATDAFTGFRFIPCWPARVLRREGLLPLVSAVMPRDRNGYDHVLNRFSRLTMPFIRYDMDADGRMTVHNETAWLYRYRDATAFAEYLYSCVAHAVRHDLTEEIGFLRTFDRAVRRTMGIVDMPDRRAALLVRLILQNNGSLSQTKRGQFAELAEIHAAIKELQEADEAPRNHRT